MATRRVVLKYPQELIKAPVLSRMAKRFDIEFSIRRARVSEELGELALELEGEPDALENSVRYLEEQGILVEPLEGDVVSP
jgi:ABC-type methionine transport system ATPase subunit